MIYILHFPHPDAEGAKDTGPGQTRLTGQTGPGN